MRVRLFARFALKVLRADDSAAETAAAINNAFAVFVSCELLSKTKQAC